MRPKSQSIAILTATIKESYFSSIESMRDYIQSLLFLWVLLIAVFTISGIGLVSAYEAHLIQTEKMLLKENLSLKRFNIISHRIKLDEILSLIASRTKMRLELEAYNAAQGNYSTELITQIITDALKSTRTIEDIFILDVNRELVTDTSGGRRQIERNVWTQIQNQNFRSNMMLEYQTEDLKVSNRRRLRLYKWDALYSSDGNLIGYVVISTNARTMIQAVESDGDQTYRQSILAKQMSPQSPIQVLTPRSINLIELEEKSYYFDLAVLKAFESKEIELNDEYVTFDGRRVISASLQIPEFHWALILTSDYQNVMKPVADLQYMVFQAACITILISSLFYTLLFATNHRRAMRYFGRPSEYSRTLWGKSDPYLSHYLTPPCLILSPNGTILGANYEAQTLFQLPTNCIGQGVSKVMKFTLEGFPEVFDPFEGVQKGENLWYQQKVHVNDGKAQYVLQIRRLDEYVCCAFLDTDSKSLHGLSLLYDFDTKLMGVELFKEVASYGLKAQNRNRQNGCYIEIHLPVETVDVSKKNIRQSMRMLSSTLTQILTDADVIGKTSDTVVSILIGNLVAGITVEQLYDDIRHKLEHIARDTGVAFDESIICCIEVELSNPTYEQLVSQARALHQKALEEDRQYIIEKAQS